MLRIPESLNSKNNSEVRIIQKFDKNKIPQVSNRLLREFRLYLADSDIKNNKKRKGNAYPKKYFNSYLKYEWIEKLLETPIEDGRKYALWKILCHYLVNIKKLGYVQAFRILKIWLEKCNNLRRLDFDSDTEIRTKLTHVKHYNPISIKKLKDENKNLYLIISQKL